MIHQLFKRCFTQNAVYFAKKKNPNPCGPKKAKPKPRICTPVVSTCKKVKTDVCKRKRPDNDNKHANPTFWKFLTCGFFIPMTIILTIKNFFFHKEHMTRPEFRKYEYMRRRVSPFPWGDGNHTLLHNPCTNALPEGYEDELCQDEILEEIEKNQEEDELKRPCG